jgi:uncharacterized protein (DUF1697 family)
VTAATQIVLVRGINVGGHQLVPMADLRAWLSQQGFVNPRTLLQSGNVVVGSPGPAGAALERALETAAAARFGFQPEFFARTVAEWQSAIERNPLAQEARDDPSHLLVLFLKHRVDAKQVKALREVSQGPERLEARGREVYIVYPEGIARSRLTQALIDRHLGGRGTARNWNTVVKLGALASA